MDYKVAATQPGEALAAVPHRAPSDFPLPPDETSGPALLISSSILMLFALITTGIRLWVRARNRLLGWDDYTIFFTVVLGLARLGCQAAQIDHGNGRHRWYIEPDEYIVSNMYGWYAQLLLFLAVCLLKVSICLLILRIKDSKKLRLFIYAVMGGLVLTNGGVIIILLSECRPIEAYWVGDGECWDSRVRIYSIYFTIAYGIITDFLCSLLPLVVVWKVHIPTRTKLLVCGLMSLGLLATGFGIGRAVSIGTATDDLTWAYCIAAIWANLELFLGITAANLALSRSAYAHFKGEHEQARQRVLASQAQSQSRASLTRSAYLQARLRCDKAELPSVTIGCGSPRDSLADHSSAASTVGGGGGGGAGAGGESRGNTREGETTATRPHGAGQRSPGIQMKTEFWLSEEELRRSSMAGQRGTGSGRGDANV